MTGFDYFQKGLIKYADFNGRASRKEFWYFFLFHALMGMSIIFFAAVTENEEVMAIVGGIFYFALLIPYLAVAARRLHDSGKSAWLLLLGIIPPGAIALFIMMMLKSQPHTNKWGLEPNENRDEWDEDDEVLDEFEFRPHMKHRDDYI